MSEAIATEPLADVQEGDYVIAVWPARDHFMNADVILKLHRVTRRTKRRVWIGPHSYRLSGQPTEQWSRDRIRLPIPGEVEGLEAAWRLRAAERNETGKQYSRKRERYIALIYAAARADRHVEFLDLLGHCESGTWDDDLARINKAKAEQEAAL